MTITKRYKLNVTIIYTKITTPFIILTKTISLFFSQLLNTLLKYLNN